MYTYIHLYIYAYIYLCRYMYMYRNMYAYMYVDVCIYVHIPIDVHVYAYVHIIWHLLKAAPALPKKAGAAQEIKVIKQYEPETYGRALRSHEVGAR